MGRKHRKPREKRGLRIEVKNNNVEWALKKFKRMVKDSGMMLDLNFLIFLLWIMFFTLTYEFRLYRKK